MNNATKHKDSFYVDMNGIVRWNSNDRVPFDDMLQDFVEAGYIGVETKSASNEARTIEAAESLANYARNYTGPSDEERFEARAAFGAGAEVVNIITGHKWIA
jgi:sugar phosphate isomerase/epimerase